MNGLKIYEFDWKEQSEKEWVAARTVIEALQTYSRFTSMDLIDFDVTDDVIEVPEEKWGELILSNVDYDPEDPEDDWKEKTFAEFMKECYEPTLIAGTMYE